MNKDDQLQRKINHIEQIGLLSAKDGLPAGVRRMADAWLTRELNDLLTEQGPAKAVEPFAPGTSVAIAVEGYEGQKFTLGEYFHAASGAAFVTFRAEGEGSTGFCLLPIASWGAVSAWVETEAADAPLPPAPFDLGASVWLKSGSPELIVTGYEHTYVAVAYADQSLPKFLKHFAAGVLTTVNPNPTPAEAPAKSTVTLTAESVTIQGNTQTTRLTA